VKRLSSTPERFAGGHGTVAEYAPLARAGGGASSIEVKVIEADRSASMKRPWKKT